MATEVKENPKFEKVAGELEAWSILEIAQFGKYLQERWGVSAAPVAVAAAGGGGGGAAPAEAEEKTEFTVILKEAGASKINVIKSPLLTGLGLKGRGSRRRCPEGGQETSQAMPPRQESSRTPSRLSNEEVRPFLAENRVRRKRLLPALVAEHWPIEVYPRERPARRARRKCRTGPQSEGSPFLVF